MRYRYSETKSKGYSVQGNDWPAIIGKGATPETALDDFISKIFIQIRNSLKTETPIPEGGSGNKKDQKTFALPLNMALKIKLHNTRLKKNVTRLELARFLGLNYDDVPDGIWLPETLRAIPCAAPKYKKVQRLFDIDHESTVREIEQAYRVLGYNVDAMPYERNRS